MQAVKLSHFCLLRINDLNLIIRGYISVATITIISVLESVQVLDINSTSCISVSSFYNSVESYNTNYFKLITFNSYQREHTLR